MSVTRIVKPLDGVERHSGVAGYMTWERLAETLRKAGELRPGEKVVQYDITGDGFQFFIEKE